MKGGQKMIWEEMDYNKPKLTMTQRLSYEREPELFDIKGEDNYHEPDEPSVCVFDCDRRILRADGTVLPQKIVEVVLYSV